MANSRYPGSCFISNSEGCMLNMRLPRVTQDQHSEISGSRFQCYYSTLTPTHFHKAPHSWSSFEHVRGTGNSSCFRQHLMGQTPLTRTSRTGRPDPVPTESRSAARPAFPPLSPPRKDECACVSRNMGALWPSSRPLYGCVHVMGLGPRCSVCHLLFLTFVSPGKLGCRGKMPARKMDRNAAAVERVLLRAFLLAGK